MKLLISCAAFLLITPVFARTSSQSDVRSARQTHASIPAPSIDALLGTELLAYVLDEDNDPQSSLTLVQSVIATFFNDDGQDEPIAGQVPSLTSLNNFINFCATRPDLQITNGRQILTGSCNPTPMGVIASTANMPSTKFIFPQTSTTVTANADFTIQLAVNNLETGHITNVRETYLAAPQVVNTAGNVLGYVQVVIESLASPDQVSPTDPDRFVFFKSLDSVAQNGVLSTTVTGGLPPGFYRLASTSVAANHQPVLVAIETHGALDDTVYFNAAIV